MVKKAWKAAIQTELRRRAESQEQGGSLPVGERDAESSDSESSDSESGSDLGTDSEQRAERSDKKRQKLDRSIRMKLRRDAVVKLWAGATEEAKQAVAKEQAREIEELENENTEANDEERTPDQYDA